MPVWPMKETAKLPSRAERSATRQPLTLSRPRPPYSSGISTPSRPSSPAWRSSARVASYFRARISGSRGIISFSMNWAAVSPIMRCSSLKSSGVKTSSTRRSSMRKLPPRAARTGVLPSVAIVISSRGRAAVEPVDHVLELLLHHPPLDLERGRQLARLQRELPREERDLLDLLELREVGGHLLDELLVKAHHLRVADQLLAAGEGHAVLPAPRLERLEVRHHQRGREVAAVADDHDLADEGVGLEPVLDRLRRHLLAP